MKEKNNTILRGKENRNDTYRKESKNDTYRKDSRNDTNGKDSRNRVGSWLDGNESDSYDEKCKSRMEVV